MLASSGLTAAQSSQGSCRVTCTRAAPGGSGHHRAARTDSPGDVQYSGQQQSCPGQAPASAPARDAWLRAVNLPPRQWRTGTPWVMDLSRNSLHRSLPAQA